MGAALSALYGRGELIRPLWPLLLGFAIWCVAFVALYAMQALGCIWGWPEGTHRLVLVAIWGASIGILGLVLLLLWRRPQTMPASVRRAGILITTAATAATCVTFFPVTFATLCL